MVQKKMTKLVVIAGPTAVGKSDTAVNVALDLNGEIIGADSMQIYKMMDIGTGKITAEEMRGVPHHLIDIVMPNEEYSVGQYTIDAKAAVSSVEKRKKLPILVGGTGLYINSLIFNHSFAGAPKDEQIRNELKYIAETEGNAKLYSILKDIDPISSATISQNDTKRIIRAIEIYRITGKPRSAFKDEYTAAYDYLLVILNDDRDKLYKRINARVDKMVANGLIDEVINLYKYKDCNSMQAIGYKELILYLDGLITKDEAIEHIKQNSRRYAKRQMTFFRGMKAEKIFLNVGSDLTDTIKRFLKL